MRTVLFFVACALLASITGCISANVVQCEGGYCGVSYKRPAGVAVRPAKVREQVKILHEGDPMPAGAKPVGVFSWKMNNFVDRFVKNGPHGRCSEEIETYFQGKAAGLGFDGVAGVMISAGDSAKQPEAMIIGQNGGVYLTQAPGAAPGTPTQSGPTGGAPMMIMVNIDYGACVGVPYVVE